MEGFFEANRVVEVSLSKLTSIGKSGNLPLRKTLLISKVLNTAQDIATSAQFSLLSSSQSSTSASKLLASFGQDQSTMDSIPTSSVRTKNLSRQQSPIAVEHHEPEVSAPQSVDEPMDFDNVSSILGHILQEWDSQTELSSQKEMVGRQTKILDMTSHPHMTDNWSTSDSCWESDYPDKINRPISPGKRNYQQAFAFGADDCISTEMMSEDFKRFKSSSLEASPLESLPGFCGYLSSKNLQTAPFITYMFGKGFALPSNPTSDWPDESEQQQKLASPLKSTSVAPILAF